MKYKLAYLLIMLLIFPGCKDELPAQKEFPVIRTFEPSAIDPSGATFSAEVIRDGNIPISSFGFAWCSTGNPEDDGTFRIELGNNPDDTCFRARINNSLAAGLEYKVRAYAVSGDKTVYGNIVSFISEGSEKSPWKLMLNDFTMDGWDNAYGFADNSKGYVIFQSSDTYEYDPASNKIKDTIDFPVDGNSGTGEFWSWVPETNEWNEIEKLPVSLDGYFDTFSFSLGSKLYVIRGGYNDGYSLWSFDPSRLY